jgi:putative addiction module killer protein
MVYDSSMNQFMETLAYADWFTHLYDAQAKARINAKIRRAELGDFGDCESIGEGVSEMRIYYGPGYRVYFLQWQQEVFIRWQVAINPLNRRTSKQRYKWRGN